MASKKRILVAPLNWGLGHAARCIPIIKALIAHGFEPVLASDGAALLLLKKEFPELEAMELPSYHITYSKKGKFFKLKLIKGLPKMMKVFRAEKKALKTIIETHNIDGVISDNRPGIYNKKVPSIYITHQLKVLSGQTTRLSTKLHQRIINKFDQCWVPDIQGEPNLSGKLGHVKYNKTITKYIGPLSRFEKVSAKIKYDILVLLSGPEPQRSLLEEKLLKELEGYNGFILFIKGKVEDKQMRSEKTGMVIYNYMTSKDLEKAINESELIISRSGYTTILDLAKLGKKAYFIPTPGQFEQEYLAKRLNELDLVPSCKQGDFGIENLNVMDRYKGLSAIDFKTNYEELFSLF